MAKFAFNPSQADFDYNLHISCVWLDLISNFNVELARFGWQGVFIKVIEVRVEERLLGRDPLAGVVHQHLLQQVQPRSVDLLHATFQVKATPIGEFTGLNLETS